MGDDVFIGLGNYINLLGDPEFKAGVVHVFSWAFWSVVIQLPLPPGCLPTLWKDDKSYLEYVTERPGYYAGHGDT